MNNEWGIDDHFECGCSSCASSNVCSKAKLQWGFPHWVGIDEQDLDQVRKKSIHHRFERFICLFRDRRIFHFAKGNIGTF